MTYKTSKSIFSDIIIKKNGEALYHSLFLSFTAPGSLLINAFLKTNMSHINSRDAIDLFV